MAENIMMHEDPEHLYATVYEGLQTAYKPKPDMVTCKNERDIGKYITKSQFGFAIGIAIGFLVFLLATIGVIIYVMVMITSQGDVIDSWQGRTGVNKTVTQLSQDVEQLTGKLAAVQTELGNQIASLITAESKRVAQLSQDVEQLTTALAALKFEQTGFVCNGSSFVQVPPVGFSVKRPKASPTPRQITFSSVITNVGAGFDKATGVFTCTIPGYYYFSASLLKDYQHDGESSCYIRKNKDDLLIAYTDPGNSPKHGNYAAVNSVFVNLEKGETVKLVDCTAVSSLTSHSSFTGFLVIPGVV